MGFLFVLESLGPPERPLRSLKAHWQEGTSLVSSAVPQAACLGLALWVFVCLFVCPFSVPLLPPVMLMPWLEEPQPARAQPGSLMA